MKKPVPGKNKNPGRHLITAIAVAVIIFAVFYLFMAALTEMRWNKESMTGSGIPVTAESQYGGKAVHRCDGHPGRFQCLHREVPPGRNVHRQPVHAINSTISVC